MNIVGGQKKSCSVMNQSGKVLQEIGGMALYKQKCASSHSN